jgi:5'-3' exoribonuclease 2
MGIPSYFSNIVKRHKSIIKRLAGLPHIHNLYMDTNGLIYDAVRVVGSNRGMSNDEYETLIINTVCNKIDEYLVLFHPSDKLMIAFDGVAPVAKLNQQRERRYKSWFTSVVEDTITRKNALIDPLAVEAGTKAGTVSEAVAVTRGTPKTVPSSQKAWNTSAITPGTTFMKKLNTRMREYCEVKARVIGNQLAYVYSGSDIPGEGEHKIFEYIRENADYHRDTTTLIYGLDADLIMLCLNHLHISQRIYLYRDTPEFIQSLDSTLSCSDQYYLDIPEFACSLEEIMRETKGNGELQHKTPYISDHKTVSITSPTTMMMDSTDKTLKITPEVVAAIDDYIVMTFMLGNDFMPHFPSLNLRTNGMTVLLQTYANMFKGTNDYLVSRSSGRPAIVWKHMRAFIGLLAETEHNRFMNEHKTRDRQGKMKFGSDGTNSNNGMSGNKRAIGRDVGTATAAAAADKSQPPISVDIRELTKIACSRVVQLVSNIERCHSLNEFMSIPLQERAAEKYIDPFRENWEFRYYDALFGIDIYAREREREGEGVGVGSKRRGGSSGGSGSIDRLQMICVNYIEGLEWTMRYYSTGCVDWRWTYKYPYAPLLVDLMRYMPHLDTALFPNATTGLKNPVRDLVQLCYVLPMASHGLLPPLLAEKLKRCYSHYYSDKLDFKWSYCKYFWEAHTELPHIRISELERVVASV